MRMLALMALLVAPRALANDYRVGEGDVLEVRVYEQPSLSGEVVVSDNCTISIALVDPVPVCGKTTGEIESVVAAAYRGDYLRNPAVTVQVTRYQSQRVDVLGSVVRPGPQFLEGRTTLLEVVSLAGGPSAENVVQVELVSPDGTKRTYKLGELATSEQVIEVGKGDKVFLMPGEVVYLEGSVGRPGAVLYADGLTVTQAIALAGGFGEDANIRRVIVNRATGDKLKVNVKRIQRGLDEDPVLTADDHLIVPRSAF